MHANMAPRSCGCETSMIDSHMKLADVQRVIRVAERDQVIAFVQGCYFGERTQLPRYRTQFSVGATVVRAEFRLRPAVKSF